MTRPCADASRRTSSSAIPGDDSVTDRKSSPALRNALTVFKRDVLVCEQLQRLTSGRTNEPARPVCTLQRKRTRRKALAGIAGDSSRESPRGTSRWPANRAESQRKAGFPASPVFLPEPQGRCVCSHAKSTFTPGAVGCSVGITHPSNPYPGEGWWAFTSEPSPIPARCHSGIWSAPHNPLDGHEMPTSNSVTRMSGGMGV